MLLFWFYGCIIIPHRNAPFTPRAIFLTRSFPAQTIIQEKCNDIQCKSRTKTHRGRLWRAFCSVCPSLLSVALQDLGELSVSSSSSCVSNEYLCISVTEKPPLNRTLYGLLDTGAGKLNRPSKATMNSLKTQEHLICVTLATPSLYAQLRKQTLCQTFATKAKLKR